MIKRDSKMTSTFSGIKKETRIPKEKERTPILTTLKIPRLHIQHPPKNHATDRLFYKYMQGVLFLFLIFSNKSKER